MIVVKMMVMKMISMLINDDDHSFGWEFFLIILNDTSRISVKLDFEKPRHNSTQSLSSVNVMAAFNENDKRASELKTNFVRENVTGAS